MVYCTKCGFKNEEDAETCAKCGAPLKMSRGQRRYRSDDECFGFREKDWEGECFSLPHAGSVLGLIFGVMIVVVGIGVILGRSFWDLFWSFILIVFGLLLVLGVLFGRRRGY